MVIGVGTAILAALHAPPRSPVLLPQRPRRCAAPYASVVDFVNPLDVDRLNNVEYGRIAEARISYGGRGRMSEIQSPNWGQQIYDRVVPF